MNRHQKLTTGHKAGEQQVETAESQTKQTPLEFATPEALLRHDAMHTVVPPRVKERLQRSAAKEPVSRPWWRRFFGDKDRE